MTNFRGHFLTSVAAVLSIALAVATSYAQTPEKTPKPEKKNQPKVRTMTIPISIFGKQELKTKQFGEILEAGEIKVREDGDDQAVLSIRSVTNTPLHIAVLIQDNLGTNVNLQLEEIKAFIRKLPADSRVMVAYLRSGTPQIRQKFTTDLEKAAASLRVVVGSESVAPNSPYEGLEEILERFEALPTGRRAVLLVSDGLDLGNSIPGQSVALDRATLKAQRNSVAIYSFYSSSSGSQGGTTQVILGAQSLLERLSDETGGRAYFQGTLTPISFEPFFKDLNVALTRQFALTYLSTHPKKGFYRIQVTSTNPEVKIDHPKGYYYRGN